jgi:uncharacterized protein
VSCLLVGAGFGILIPQSTTDPEIRNYVPRNMSSRISTDIIEKEFGGQDMIVILFSDSSILEETDLRQIQEIDKGISRLKGVSGRISPFTIKNIRGQDGIMVAEPLIDKIPVGTSDIRHLKNAVLNNRFARDIVISSDMTTAAITVTINFNENEKSTLHRIDSVIRSHPGKAGIMTGGLPYIRQYIVKDVRKDGMFLVPAALIIMLMILKLTLGDWKSVLQPFTVVVLSTAISMGLIPILGWKISIISLLIPVIIVAVANNYGIYLVTRQQEIFPTLNGSRRELLEYLTHSLNMPILFSGLTTIAGILGLLTHSIIPAKQVGILAATGVTIALLMSLTFIPALIYMQGTGIIRPKDKPLKRRFSDKLLTWLSGKIVQNPKKILITGIGVTLLLSSGMLFLRVETNQENYFPRGHPARSASGIINEKFGGSQIISVMLEGNISDPLVMNKIDNLTNRLEKIDGVGKVFSISQVVREMTKAIYSKGEPGYDAIPASGNALAQLFELYNMSGDQNDFNQLMNVDNSKAHILVRLSNPEIRVINDLKLKISELTSGIPVKVYVGGYAIIMADFAGSIIRGQSSSLVFAIVTVLILLAIIFRSLKGGLTGSVPLIASILIMFGFMGISGIALDSATALLSSIMIGVGVDFTIQYMWCFKIAIRNGLTFEDATASSLSTIGRSIIINGLSVMAGFSALMLSGFSSIRFFGYLVFISIGTCLIGAIVFIPAFLIVFKPAFISSDFKINKA